MTEPVKAVQCVVAFDFTPAAEHALGRAVEVASRAPNHHLHVVAALDDHDRLSVLSAGEQPSYTSAERIHELVLRHVTAAFAGRPTAEDVHFFVHVRIGRAVAEILGVATEVGADLIFVGSHGKTGMQRLLLGSVSEHIVREAGCPVMVARAKTYKDVVLEPVMFYDHARTPHRSPHQYTYTNRQVITRPNEWPIS